jgi:hypothetical protein
MILKIGNKVRFLNEVGGGVVSAIINEKMVEVETDDGFVLPILSSELLLEAEGGYNMSKDVASAAPKVENVEKQVSTPIKTEDYRYMKFKGEAFLAIVPDNEKMLYVSNFKLYLINDSSYTLNYLISQKEGSVSELISSGTLEPDTKELIKQFSQSGISKIKSLQLQGLFLKEGLFDPQPALDSVSYTEGIIFYKANEYKENAYFNSSAILFKTEQLNMDEVVKNLSKSDILKVTQEKEKKPVKKKKPVNPEIEEVDLHIEEILDSHSGMSNGEIIEVQLGRFETALETALKSESKKIVFIHGLGNGKLKLEVRKILDRKYPKLRYQDASFKEYGFGATMVTLK